MDINTLEAVVKKVANSSVHQVTVSEGDQSITVVNRSQSQVNSAAQPATTQQSSQNNSAASTESPSKHIASTYVGYVQLGQDAAAAPLVQPGDTVEVGQTMAYVDVLSKLMPVLSEVSGEVDKILVTNGDKVDYAKPLIELR